MSFLTRLFGILGYSKTPSKSSDTKYAFYHHQAIVVQPNTTVVLDRVLFDTTQDFSDPTKIPSHLFPLVVGDHGNLIAAGFGRRVLYKNDPHKTRVYLEYILDNTSMTKLLLCVSGCYPQTITITKDQRNNPDDPLVMFLYSPRQMVPPT